MNGYLSHTRGWSRKMKGEVAKVARAKGVPWNFRLINYSLGCVNCFVLIHVLLQLSVFYIPPSWREWSKLCCLAFVLSILCLPCLSDWFASHHFCLQECLFLHTQGRWLATQSTPRGSAPAACSLLFILLIVIHVARPLYISQVLAQGKKGKCRSQ